MLKIQIAFSLLHNWLKCYYSGHRRAPLPLVEDFKSLISVHHFAKAIRENYGTEGTCLKKKHMKIWEEESFAKKKSTMIAFNIRKMISKHRMIMLEFTRSFFVLRERRLVFLKSYWRTKKVNLMWTLASCRTEQFFPHWTLFDKVQILNMQRRHPQEISGSKEFWCLTETSPSCGKVSEFTETKEGVGLL